MRQRRWERTISADSCSTRSRAAGSRMVGIGSCTTLVQQQCGDVREKWTGHPRTTSEPTSAETRGWQRSENGSDAHLADLKSRAIRTNDSRLCWVVLEEPGREPSNWVRWFFLAESRQTLHQDRVEERLIHKALRRLRGWQVGTSKTWHAR